MFCIRLGMASLDGYLDQQLERGRAYFSRQEALAALGLAPQNLAAAISRLIRKRRLANPRHGFYLILRPEDRALGAPDPVRSPRITTVGSGGDTDRSRSIIFCPGA